MYVLFNQFSQQSIQFCFIIKFQIAGVSIPKQPFAVISSADGMSTREYDGLLGMGYQQIANGGENPVIWSMYLAGELQQPIFSFWFGP